MDVAAALLPLAVVLALILIGVVQGRENRYDFAALRWEAWQLVGGLVVLVLFAAHAAKVIALGIALLFAVAVLVRKRRTQGESDYYF
jgi:O-antigen/teichoic acid export membrane protein